MKLMYDGAISVIPIQGVGEIIANQNLADAILECYEPDDYDVLVVTQKVVSKAEGRIVKLKLDEDVRAQIETLVYSESRRILRRRGDLIITETNSGYICANAGIDKSNVTSGEVSLLPLNPDRSARRIRDRIKAKTSKTVGVIVSDTFGRAWRNGVCDVALGVAGIAAIVDLRGTNDAYGQKLEVTEIALADEIAAAAELVKPKAGNIPAIIVRGIPKVHFRESSIQDEVIRAYSSDLFR